MNYDQARQTIDGAGWRWTTMNEYVRTAWPCYDCPPHTTREEAERHYYDASLETVEEIGISWSLCAVPECANPADKMLGNRGMWRAFKGEPLCDEHRTREQLASLYPFTPGMASIHS